MKNLTKDEWEIFDFTEAEAKIVHALKEKGTLSVSALSRAVKLPRSTVDDALKRLNERRLVRRVSKGYASVWRLVKPVQLAQEFNEVADSLGAISEAEQRRRDMRDVFGVRISETSEVKIYRGAENIVRVYINFFTRSGIDRVHAIQTAEAARSWLERMPPKFTKEVNEEIKKSGLVLEGVLTEDIKDIYRLFVERDPTWADAFGERPRQAIRLVSKEWLTGNMEFLISKKMVVMNNWPEDMIIVIEDANVALFLEKLYGFLFEAGKTFDQNEFVRNLVNERK